MAVLNKISLFTYLLGNENYKKINDDKDVFVSSPEALAMLAALSFNDRPRKMFFLFPTIYEAESFYQFLGDYVREDECYFFPYDEIFRTSAIGVSPEMNDERLLALSSIVSDKPSILVAHMSSSMMSILSKEKYDENILEFKKGEFFNITEVVKRVSAIGYLSCDRVGKSGQFAKRGGILDIYDPAYPDPVRIEFFGDEIDDIRFFKANDELSYRHVDSFALHPCSLFLLNSDEIRHGLSMVQNSLKAMAETSDRLSFDDLQDRMRRLGENACNGFLPAIDQRFYSLFQQKLSSLLDYLDGYSLYLYDAKACLESRKDILKKEKDYFRKSHLSGFSLPEEKVYRSEEIGFANYHQASLQGESAFVLRENSYRSLSYAESDRMVRQYLQEGNKVRIVLPEPNLSNFQNYLAEKEIPFSLFPKHTSVMLIEGKITHGFEIPEEKHVYLSAKEIYGVSDQRSRFLSRYKESKIIRRYEDLKEGDYVVHEVHGVGRYMGVTTLDGLEYLKIEYADEAIFFLPLNQYRLIRKYASREGYAPSLDKIGGSTWSRKKAKIRSKISYLADQLLSLYSERRSRTGFAFPTERELEDAFLRTFPYPYTRSQREAMEDVRKDMESPYPMDRLVAGDVGFGKTEIAFYAAFKAVLAHKQVAFLCPTTILCDQHFKVAKSRLATFGIRICAFSRFVSKKKQEENIKKIRKGEFDLVIGTHRLLSDDIVFKDLGLLIIDEEQKFGVAHKEKIKEKSKNIDCLTLTATPIPRTMQMSLLNVRSLSLLEEPPINRMPVKTYVAKMDWELVYEVIDKELQRRGQVYFLHNDIKSIFMMRDKLAKKFPDARVDVVHAKMNQDDIERTMAEFYSGDIDVLVCTSIIESGLDIPNVNTIIVENADHFGLAQLYQIKGRVGRSDRLAYAYFFFRDSGKLTDEARKRLKALKDFTELGSGYKIAMQDLNIRGAGDILGSEQAGFVDTLGYDAYMDLLTEVVKEKEFAENARAEEENRYRFELSFSLDAHIPEDYGNEEQRISMYRELSDCIDDERLSAFSKKLRDVYGPYPEEVSNLLLKRKIEIELNSDLYSDFVEGLGVYVITTSDLFSSRPSVYKGLESLLKPMFVKLRVKINQRRFEFHLTKTKEYLQDLLFLVTTVKQVYDGEGGPAF